MHWAIVTAERIIRERPKERYVLESGITPSGFIHAGNFRELFTTWIVGEALKRRGKEVVVQHFWDDMDRFRKVPRNVPREWEQYIGMPVSRVPDPWGCHDSYADHFESLFEEEVRSLGIDVTFVRAKDMYETGKFADFIRLACERREEIRRILNKYRERAGGKPLDTNWWPVTIYCERCGKDSTEIIEWDGAYKFHYRCACGHEGVADARKGNVKMRWRVDWPARWTYFGIDFEPGGKDHLAAGSSWDTGKEIVKVLGGERPLTLMYEWVGVKGMGEMHGSKGNVVLISDLLEIYEPEVLLFLYARYRPNKKIELDFGMDVLRQYDAFDDAEQRYFKGEIDDLTQAYDLVVREKKPRKRVPFRILVNLVQIPGINIEEALKRMGREFDESLHQRVEKAKRWVEKYAPANVRFTILHEIPKITVGEKERKALEEIARYIEKGVDADTLQNILHRIPEEFGLEKKAFFALLYQLFLGKTRGPRAATLLLGLPRDFVLRRLRLNG